MNSVRFDEPYDHIHHTVNIHEDNHLIDTHKQDMKNNEVEQDEFYEDTNYDLINEKELYHIHPDLDHNFPSPTMN